VVVRHRLNSLVKSHENQDLKSWCTLNSFPAWCSIFMRWYGEQAGKFTCYGLGQGTSRDASSFEWFNTQQVVDGRLTWRPKGTGTFSVSWSRFLKFCLMAAWTTAGESVKMLKAPQQSLEKWSLNKHTNTFKKFLNAKFKIWKPTSDLK